MFLAKSHLVWWKFIMNVTRWFLSVRIVESIWASISVKCANSTMMMYVVVTLSSWIDRSFIHMCFFSVVDGLVNLVSSSRRARMVHLRDLQAIWIVRDGEKSNEVGWETKWTNKDSLFPLSRLPVVQLSERILLSFIFSPSKGSVRIC